MLLQEFKLFQQKYHFLLHIFAASCESRDNIEHLFPGEVKLLTLLERIGLEDERVDTAAIGLTGEEDEDCRGNSENKSGLIEIGISKVALC